MKTLFISFTRLLTYIRRGEVSQDELDTGLFCFGSAKEYVFGSTKDAEALLDNLMKTFFASEAEGRLALKMVQDAVAKAEKEGRAAFRKLGEPNTHANICKLLRANGIDVPDVDYDHLRPHYDYDSVHKFFGDLVKVEG